MRTTSKVKNPALAANDETSVTEMTHSVIRH
jgi:hypothetical protein